MHPFSARANDIYSKNHLPLISQHEGWWSCIIFTLKEVHNILLGDT